MNSEPRATRKTAQHESWFLLEMAVLKWKGFLNQSSAFSFLQWCMAWVQKWGALCNSFLAITGRLLPNQPAEELRADAAVLRYYSHLCRLAGWWLLSLWLSWLNFVSFVWHVIWTWRGKGACFPLCLLCVCFKMNACDICVCTYAHVLDWYELVSQRVSLWNS